MNNVFHITLKYPASNDRIPTCALHLHSHNDVFLLLDAKNDER